MQSDRQYLPPKSGPPLADQVGNVYARNAPMPSFFGGSSPNVRNLLPFQNVDFQPAKVCPRNFIIFDQTGDRSRVMYHPAITPKFCCPDLSGNVNYLQNTIKRSDTHDEIENSSFLKEDSADIDALLSMEDEEDEYDEEELSTACTNGGCADDTADSCSSKPRKNRLIPRSSSSHKSTGSGSGSCSSRGGRKRQKMRDMVEALRGIVPGGNQMNTVGVLDEAVRYLKSLKVEVQKIGVANLKNY